METLCKRKRMSEDGFSLVDVMLVLSIMGALYIIAFFFLMLPATDNAKLRSVAKGLESWSVANPTSVFAHAESFPLKGFLKESDFENAPTADYNIKRVSSDTDDFICFVETKGNEKVLAYSYQREEIVDSQVCKS